MPTGRYDRLSTALRERRAALGASRQAIADASGLSYPYLAQLEGGHRIPSIGAAQRLAQALGMALEDLVAHTVEEPGAGSTWYPNPSFDALEDVVLMAAAPSPDGPRSRDEHVAEVVAGVVETLSRLPVSERLDALNRVQAAVVAGVVEG